MPERKYHRKVYRNRKIVIFLKLTGSLALFSLFCVLTVFVYYAKDFPRPEVFTERQLAQSTKIYDRTGQVLLYEIYGEEKRTWVALDVIPKHLQQTVLVAEDADFYNHFGVDAKGIARAILSDLKLGELALGGSTIPQQLIRSTFLSPNKTIERKTREIVLALELDRRYPKDKILEWYLNQVPFGQNAYGVEAASQTYFGKPVSQISLAESASLTALIRAPYRFTPYTEDGKKELLIRKDYVLDQLVKKGYKSREEAEQAKKEELMFIENKTEIKAPYFTLWVKQQLEEKYGEAFLRERGLKIYTSLDWEMQKIAEQSVRDGIEENKAYNAYNAGLVALSPKTGEVLALSVGTGDYDAEPLPEGCISGKTCFFDPKFNVVVGTRENPGRQPGSAFKPFAYVTAFQNGYNDKTVVIDEPTCFGIWGGKQYCPENYDGSFRGPIFLRQALAQSLNIPAVKVLLNLAGLESTIKTTQDLGISTLSPPYGPAIVLGGWEVKLLEMTSAYGVFAADGLRMETTSILSIEDLQGNLIYKNKKTPRRVLETNAVKILNDILSDNDARTPMFGARSNLFFPGYSVAAKTGTTDDYRDAWTIGYTPSVATGVWVGNNNNAPMKKRPAVTGAGSIFHSFMEKAILMFPKEEFAKPE